MSIHKDMIYGHVVIYPRRHRKRSILLCVVYTSEKVTFVNTDMTGRPFIVPTSFYRDPRDIHPSSPSRQDGPPHCLRQPINHPDNLPCRLRLCSPSNANLPPVGTMACVYLSCRRTTSP